MVGSGIADKYLRADCVKVSNQPTAWHRVLQVLSLRAHTDPRAVACADVRLGKARSLLGHETCGARYPPSAASESVVRPSMTLGVPTRSGGEATP